MCKEVFPAQRRAWWFALLLWLTSAAAMAQDALHLIVPFAPGGGGDQMARLLAPELSTALHRPVLVENLPGANGALGMMRLKAARPDERLLVLASDHASLLFPLMSPAAQYDTRRDFRIVGHVARHAYALAVPMLDGAAPATLDDLIRLLPQQAVASIAVPAEGGLPESMARALAQRAGVDVAVIPYRGGQPAALALLGGQVSAAAIGLSNVLALQHQGRARILAVSGRQRSPSLPWVPTFEELGLPGLTMTSSWALFAARHSTMDLPEIHQALRRVMASVGLQARLQALGLDPLPVAMSMADSAAALDQAILDWTRLLALRDGGRPLLAHGRSADRTTPHGTTSHGTTAHSSPAH